MFNIQPGQGLGFTGSKQIALGLGATVVVVIIDPSGEPVAVFGLVRDLEAVQGLISTTIGNLGIIDDTGENIASRLAEFKAAEGLILNTMGILSEIDDTDKTVFGSLEEAKAAEGAISATKGLLGEIDETGDAVDGEI